MVKKLKTASVKAGAVGAKKAASVIAGGGIVVFPTETSYGIAADATNPAAVEKVFGAKGREKEKALSIIVAGGEMAREYCQISALAQHLIQLFMPGPLTLVVKRKKGKLAENISQNGTVAFRIPGHSFALDLVKKAGRPVTATSANPSGAPPVHDPEEARELFEGRADLVVDGGRLSNKPPSALVDVTVSPPKLLRDGALAKKAMKAARDFVKAQEAGNGICAQCGD
ncbi:MAG: L-threonylcarbamoyladenylate synthase [Candidatus Micrarchaeota archaeon]|nr:L-threonylcarbamoyladenylate synthase [Candidatus Micrarchaeota archaeon]